LNRPVCSQSACPRRPAVFCQGPRRGHGEPAIGAERRPLAPGPMAREGGGGSARLPTCPGLWGTAGSPWVVGTSRLETRTEEFPCGASLEPLPSGEGAYLTRCRITAPQRRVPRGGRAMIYQSVFSQSATENTRKPVSFTTGCRRFRKQNWRTECSADVQIACLTEVKGRKTHRTG